LLPPFIHTYSASAFAAKAVDSESFSAVFRIPYGFHLPTSQEIRSLCFNKEASWAFMLGQTGALVLEQVAMLASFQLDNFDEILQGSYNIGIEKPFADFRMLFIGDPFSLTPIVRKEDQMAVRKYYPSPYFFDAKAFQQLRPLVIPSNAGAEGMDPAYQALLNDIRAGQKVKHLVSVLNQRVRHQHRSFLEKGIEVVWANEEAQTRNNWHFTRLQEPEYSYMAEIKGEFPTRATHPPQHLRLKEGARVFFAEDDANNQYYYGELGTVCELDENRVVVQKDDGQQVVVERKKWAHHKWLQHSRRKGEYQEVAWMRQYPLKLGYTITLYQSVGLCFERIYVLKHAKRFSGALLYTALTRCTSLEGLELERKLKASDLQVDKAVQAFVQGEGNTARLEEVMQDVVEKVRASAAKSES